MEYIRNDVVVFGFYESRIVRDKEDDELNVLGTIQGLNRVMEWFGMTEEQRQSLRNTSVLVQRDDIIEIGDIDLNNMGENNVPPKKNRNRWKTKGSSCKTKPCIEETKQL